MKSIAICHLELSVQKPARKLVHYVSNIWYSNIMKFTSIFYNCKQMFSTFKFQCILVFGGSEYIILTKSIRFSLSLGLFVCFCLCKQLIRKHDKINWIYYEWKFDCILYPIKNFGRSYSSWRKRIIKNGIQKEKQNTCGLVTQNSV